MTEILNLQRELNDLKRTGLDYVSTQTLAQEQSAEIDAHQLEMTIKRNQALDKMTAANKLKEDYKDNPELSRTFTLAAIAAKDEFTQLEKVQKIQDTIFFLKQKIAVIDNSYKEQATIREQTYKNDVQQLDIKQQLLNAETEIFQINTKLQPYTDQQLKSEEYSFKLRQADLQASKDLLEVTRARNEALAQLERDESVRAMILAENGLKVTEEEQKQFKAKKTNAEAYWTRQTDLVNTTNKGRKEAIDLTYSLSARQEAYGDIFKNTFIGMGDALAEFAKTGKLNFKGLIDSMLSDLIRWELKQQSIAAYQSFGGASGIAGGIGKFLGFSGGTNPIGPSGYSDLGTFNSLMSAGGLAKGGAFDQGYPIHKFAMGGAFTNQIVSSPTMFKFASGTGLMGEAGPEAIMPLKRDGSGNLGVRSQPSNVSVVVNNHSGQPATTNETVDSRGNRSIEVIVGDVVAQQIATKNSPVQQSMSSTYGSSPALVRR
jgi:phage-related minor tail protein